MKRLNSKFTESQLQLIRAGDKRFHIYRAITLKYYEVHNKFVSGVPKISGSVLKNIVKNLGFRSSVVYIPSERSIRMFRRQLKQYFNPVAELQYKKELRRYLTDVIGLEGIFEYDALEEHAMNFLDTLSARSAMSVLTIDRIIKSVLYQYEKALFRSITDSLDDVTKAYLDGLLIMHSGMSWMSHISRWMRGVNASNVAFEVEKLNFLKLLNYPPILSSLTSKHLKRYYRNILSKYPSAIKDIPDVSKYAQLVIFCFVKRAEISDRLADILINITHKIFTAGVNKSRLKFSKLKEVKKNYNAKKTLKILVNAILDSEDNIVKDAIYPKFAKSKLIEIKQGLSDSPSETFEDLSYGNTRSSFVHYYRKIIVPILEAIEFDSDNKDMIRALELIKMNINKHEQCYTNDQEIAFENVVKRSHRKKVLDSKNRINRIDLELCALHKLRNKLRVKEVWIRDGCKYRNPAYDLPQDFDEKKSKYFSIINATEDVDEFIVSLKNKLRESLSSLNDNLPKNHYVQILKKPRGHVKIAKLSKQEPPPQLELIKSEVFNRWPCTSLLDVLKETDLFVNFTGDFVANGTKIGMSQAEMQKRLLLIILGYGTNTGLKSMSNTEICIYSQLKSCTSSEVAAMLEGILKHGTDAKIEKNYVDSHGASEVGFAFSYLFNFSLLPRYKNIHKQKLYYTCAEDFKRYENLSDIMIRPINFELIKKHYDYIIKHAVALKLGIVDAESVMKKFTKNNVHHEAYHALRELGRAVKTIFLCDYFSFIELRQEIHEALNVVERWNGINDFIFYGKTGSFRSNNPSELELSMLCLHLLQLSMVYINTLMLQQVVEESNWLERMEIEDKRAISPLLNEHISPYGDFTLDLAKRLAIKVDESILQRMAG